MHAHQNIGLAAILNACLTAMELTVFYLTNSLAVGTSAVHDLGDCFLLGFAYWSEKPARQKTRLPLVSAFLNGAVLFLGAVWVMGEGAWRVIFPENVQTFGLLWLAAFGLFLNGLTGLNLSRGQTHNEKILSWHFFEDFFGYLGVMLVAGAARFMDISRLDPALALLFAAFIAWNALRNLRRVAVKFFRK